VIRRPKFEKMNNFFCRPVVLAIFWIVAFARADSSALWELPPGTTAVVTGTYYYTSLQGVSILFVIGAFLIRSSFFCFCLHDDIRWH
jgi:hypothetical protein